VVPVWRKDRLIRTLLTGIVALAAVAAVLGGIFLVGLARIRLADRPAPVAPVAILSPSPPRIAPAPAVQAPATQPIADPLPIATNPSIDLPAEKARLSGNLKLENDAPSERPHHSKRPQSPPDPPPILHQAITHFQESGDTAEWTAAITRPGLYEIDLIYASSGPRDKSETCILSIGDQDLRADTLHTRGRENYQVLTVGNLTLSPGPLTLRLHLSDRSPGSQLRLRALRLIPAG
jgi:hypothetical protein